MRTMRILSIKEVDVVAGGDNAADVAEYWDRYWAMSAEDRARWDMQVYGDVSAMDHLADMLATDRGSSAFFQPISL
jgi:hypothetical protein